jgi:hypothetical protein
MLHPLGTCDVSCPSSLIHPTQPASNSTTARSSIAPRRVIPEDATHALDHDVELPFTVVTYIFKVMSASSKSHGNQQRVLGLMCCLNGTGDIPCRLPKKVPTSRKFGSRTIHVHVRSYPLTIWYLFQQQYLLTIASLLLAHPLPKHHPQLPHSTLYRPQA